MKRRKQLFNIIRIINFKTNLCKEIEIEDYNPKDLNIIVDLYENHDDYAVERF